jgi:DNA-binding IclR family transcriptional regulator
MQNNKEKANQVSYKTVSNVAKILMCLSEENNTVTDVAIHGGFSKPTASRLLKALEKSNMAFYDPVHRKYFLGPLLGRLMANTGIAHLGLITSSIGEMDRLSEIFGETVALGILDGIQHIRLYAIPSRFQFSFLESVNNYPVIPHFQGAATKVLLSQLGRRELAVLINNIELEKLTDNSDIDKNNILLEINKIREQGYAVTHGEKIPGGLAIAAIVKGYQFPAGLSIIGSESRLEAKLQEVVSEIINSANSISSNLQKNTNLEI